MICEDSKRKRKTKKVWENEWLPRRTERGVHKQLLEELRLEDEKILANEHENMVFVPS